MTFFYERNMYTCYWNTNKAIERRFSIMKIIMRFTFNKQFKKWREVTTNSDNNWSLGCSACTWVALSTTVKFIFSPIAIILKSLKFIASNINIHTHLAYSWLGKHKIIKINKMLFTFLKRKLTAAYSDRKKYFHRTLTSFGFV